MKQSLSQLFKSKALALTGEHAKIARGNQARADTLFAAAMITNDELRRARFVTVYDAKTADALKCPLGSAVVEFRDQSKIYLPGAFCGNFVVMIRKAIEARTPQPATGRKVVKSGSMYHFQGLRP